MNRRDVLLTGAAGAAFALAGGLAGPRAFAQPASPPLPPGATPEDARLRALLDKIFFDQVDESPQSATSLGLDKGARAAERYRLDDRSAEEKARRLAHAEQRLAALEAIDRAKLTGLSPVDLDVVTYTQSTAVEAGRRFTYGSVGGRFSPYVVSQLTGSYQDVPDFLDSSHKIETAADADAYLSRLRAFPVALDQDLARQKSDVARGVIPPDFVIDTTLQQLTALRNQSAASTVLVASLVRRAGKAGLTEDYAGPATRLVETEVFPALDRHIAAVQALRPRATPEAGIYRLPDGEAYYAGALKAATTTTLSPDEVHKLGLDQVAEITAGIDDLLKGQGMTQGTVAARLTALNDDPRQLYPNTDEGRAALLDQLNRQIAAMYQLLPRDFTDLPAAKVEVHRVPVFIQDGAANGYYNGAPLDGSRPAIYYINLKDTHDWPKFSLPTLTYHEAVPGHHLQISTAQESTSIPLLRRRGGFAAYSEGWALYAEQLADQLGVYQGDPLGRAGYLQSFLFRAARLVVDTGMHSKRWSRARATDYLVQATGYARPRSQREIDRYCVWPGQACSYKIGHTVWTRLRRQSEAKLGPKFDVKRFHEVLRNGAMPLTVLESVVAQRDAAMA